MNIGYVEQKEKASSIKEKINKKKLIINQEEEKLIFKMPTEISEKRMKKTLERLIRKMNENEIDTVILDEKIKEFEIIKNKIFSNDIHIIDGRFLQLYLIPKIVDRILEQLKRIKEDTEISFLVNDNNEINIKNISKLAQRVKNCNIVTNHMENFKQIEDLLYREYGIMINITNNRRKSLMKSNIIINIDFSLETIEKYSIPNEAIIVNCLNKFSKIKYFRGQIFNNYKIKMPEKYCFRKYKNEYLYESLVFGKEYNYIEEKINLDKIEVEAFLP